MNHCCGICSQTEQFTVLWILFASIVLGNTAVLVALLLNKARKSRMNFFIMHLALAGKETLQNVLSYLVRLHIMLNIVRLVKSRRMRWAGHEARMGEGRGVHRVLVGKPEGKRPLGRPRRRWEDNMKMDLQELGGDCEDWMELAQDRDKWRALVGTVMNLRVPKMRGIC